MKKSKWDVIGKDIDRESNQYYDSWFYYWYDGEDYYYDDYYDYVYTDTIYQDYVSKRGIRVTLERLNMGSYIDMMSVSDPQLLRQKKINYLLGIEKWEVENRPTIKDLYDEKYSRNNKKRR